MKTIYEHPIGGDGGKAGAYVDESNITVSVSYPISKVIEPATKAVDNLLDKLKDLIPGNWDDPIIEGLKDEYKKDLVKLIGA